MNKYSNGFSLADMFPSAKLLQVMSIMRYKLELVQKQGDEMHEKILMQHKEKHREGKQESGEAYEDHVDVLLKIQQRGDFEPQLTDTNSKAVIFASEVCCICGFLEWAISELIKPPEVIKRAQDEFQKNVASNVKSIPAKARAITNLWAIGRDPRHRVEAEKLNPGRFIDSKIDYKETMHFEHIPFGAGRRRICPGISFALQSIEFMLAQLLFHFDLKLPGELNQEELDMTEKFGVTMRRKQMI
ncbi:tabersonine 16-hydroxylase 1-like [Coffea eugenioides]|uniref:tabersonine 16-hydroxylase 1-like n=1 Tax=Coffea eugenioides TaxID=49369 RepID=UPI000F608395|nr:tabersonine 16-hydroxylase 1-like [Coffea eugenioides]XP_027169298.1 tabersonine 16-hydroxylase 1-like [Coffea eugenioides]